MKKRLLVIQSDPLVVELLRKGTQELMDVVFATKIIVEGETISFIDDQGARIHPSLPSFHGIVVDNQLGDEWEAGKSVMDLIGTAVTFGSLSHDTKWFIRVGNQFDQSFMSLQEGLGLAEDTDYFDTDRPGTMRLLGALRIWSEPYEEPGN